jgi:DNA gyrase/topoisomerase IV subunit A
MRPAAAPSGSGEMGDREGRAGHRGPRWSPRSLSGAQGKLIEQIAALIADRKLPILADVRDESPSEIRIVIEPRSRTVDPRLLMDSLFRLTDLEVAVPLNLNVLDATARRG